MNETKRKEIIDEQLHSFNLFTGPVAKNREQHNFDDTSFTEVTYDIPEGLTEEDCRMIVLGAMLDEKVCSDLVTSSSGAEEFGMVSFNQTFFLSNVFHQKGDSREQDFGRGIKKARLMAKEALDKFKTDPSLAIKYMGNAVKRSMLEVSNPFSEFNTPNVRYMTFCKMGNNCLQKEPFKSGVSLSDMEKQTLNANLKNLNLYTEMCSVKHAGPGANKDRYIKLKLASTLLMRYNKREEDAFIDSNLEKEEKKIIASIVQEHPEMRQELKKKGKSHYEMTLDEMYEEFPDLDIKYSKKLDDMRSVFGLEFTDSYKKLSTFINSCESEEELTDKLFGLISTTKAYKKAKEITDDNELKNAVDYHKFEGEREELFDVLDGKVNSLSYVSPLEERLESFRKTEGVLHGHSEQYQHMIEDLYNFIDDSKEIGKTPSKYEITKNFEKMQTLAKSVDTYIKHKTDEPDKGAIGSERLKQAQELKEFLSESMENQQKRLNVAGEKIKNRKAMDLIYSNDKAKTDTMNEELEPLYNFTSETVKLREKHNFKDTSFTDIKYNIPPSLDKDTCRLITLGAMLEPELCGKLNTSSTGAEWSGKVTMSQTFFLHNVFSANGDARESEFGGGIKEARINAKEAIENFDKDPSKAIKMIENVAKYTMIQIPSIYGKYASESMRFIGIECKAAEVMKKEPFKSGVNLTDAERTKFNSLTKSLDIYSFGHTKPTLHEFKDDKDRCVDRFLISRYLYSINDVNPKQEEIDREIADLNNEMKEKAFNEFPEIKEHYEKEGYDVSKITWDQLLDGEFNEKLSKLNLESRDKHYQIIMKHDSDTKLPEFMSDAFENNEEMIVFLNDYISGTKKSNDLKAKTPEELVNDVDAVMGPFHITDKEKERFVSIVKGEVNAEHLVTPMEESLAKFKETEGLFHGQSPQYSKMVKALDNYVKETKTLGKKPSKNDINKNLARMEGLLESVEDYISYKTPQLDSGKTGTARLREAKQLRKFLSESLEDQKNAIRLSDKVSEKKDKQMVKNFVKEHEKEIKSTQKVKVKEATKEKDKSI